MMLNFSDMMMSITCQYAAAFVSCVSVYSIYDKEKCSVDDKLPFPPSNPSNYLIYTVKR